MTNKAAPDRLDDEDPATAGFSAMGPRGRIWMQAEFDGTVKRMDWRGREGKHPSRVIVEKLVAQREQARTEKRFELADDLGKQLHALGVSFEDRITGMAWWWRRDKH